MSPISSSPIKTSALLAGLALVLAVGQFSQVECKFLRPLANYNHGPDFGGYPEESIRTGERAIVTVRGARNTLSGLPPRHLALEGGPYPGGFPRRGVYDNLDGYDSPRWGGMPSDLVPVGPYHHQPMGFDRYRMNHFGRPSPYGEEAPARIAVTGVYPAGGFRERF